MNLTHAVTQVSKTHFVIFGDQSWPVDSLVKILPEQSDISVFIEGEGWVTQSFSKKIRHPNKKNQEKGDAKKLLKGFAYFEDRAVNKELCPFIAIVGIENSLLRNKLLEKIKHSALSLKVLELGSRHKTRSHFASAKRKVFWGDVMAHSLEHEMLLLQLQDRVRELRDCFKNSERIALLLQDDPDPDGLASALALRKLLGRNSQTASICSFGSITRPENLAMSKLLEIDVQKANLLSLTTEFDKVVLVDCQPSFFKGRPIPAHVVLDHHPFSLTEAEIEVLDFVEVREDLGSISTLLTLYLQAADIEVSQRLATALLYGIKSDTLMLNRQVSGLDLEAFVFLYPLIHFTTMRRIERPELPFAYLMLLKNALDFVKSAPSELCILPLGAVKNEEWIPQAADFALQIEGTKLAAAVGIFENKIVISARMCGGSNHLGEHFKGCFDQKGAAGGHRSMAKAIVRQEQWLKCFGGDALESSKLVEILTRELEPLLKDRNE